MATVSKTFSVRTGLDVANTIVISNTSGVLNVSNITLINVVTSNVSGNLAVGNIAVTQNATFGNISAATGANLTSLNVSANISNTGNLLVTQNTFTGNLAVTQNISAGNVNLTGGMTIAGNLIVNGSTVTLNSSVVQTNDQYILLTANNQTADILDYGFAGLAKNATIGNAWSGLIKHHNDEVWYLFDGYAQTATLTLNTASLNIAQTNVATINANVFAQYINVATINVGTFSQPITQFANNGIYVAGTLVANNPNINFVSANTSNLSITGTSNVSPGNVTITLDTRSPGGGGAYEVDIFHGGTSVQTNSNLNFNDSQSVLYTITANGATQVNLSAAVNTTLNLTSLNVTANIANTGNLLVTQNTFTGNLTVTQNVSAGNVGVSGNLYSTGVLAVNTMVVAVNTVTLTTVSQSVLANLTAATGQFATVECLVQANCASMFHVTKLTVVTDGVNVAVDEYGTILTGSPVGTLTAAISTGNVQLLFTANNATSTVVRTVMYGIAV